MAYAEFPGSYRVPVPPRKPDVPHYFTTGAPQVAEVPDVLDSTLILPGFRRTHLPRVGCGSAAARWAGEAMALWVRSRLISPGSLVFNGHERRPHDDHPDTGKADGVSICSPVVAFYASPSAERSVARLRAEARVSGWSSPSTRRRRAKVSSSSSRAA